MARKVKMIIDENGVDKRETGYYSTPDFIARYISEQMLRINPNGHYVLDPAVGKEELLKTFHDNNKEIDSFDIIDYGVHPYSNFHKENFIEYYKNLKANLFFKEKIDSKYDYIIANPPYNCHEVSYIHDNKKWLNKLFPVGAYNMYSMFLSAMIDMAKEGCVIGVIISDSFLTSSYHSKLRNQIFNECSIHQIILCPTDLFWSQKADVRTCIMILQKGRKYQGDILIANRAQNISDFKEELKAANFKHTDLDSIRLNCGRTSNQILIDVDDSIIKLFKTLPALGDLYKCVTCISTGDDKKYLSATKKEGFTVPFYKNPASRKFVASEDAYLIDAFLSMPEKDKNFMVRNKQLLNLEGIACSSMGLPFSAVYKPANAVTGVNPTIFPPKQDIDWLISYLNSSLVTYLVRGVLIRSNMVTSGYVSCIPIPFFSMEEKGKLAEIASNVRNGKLEISKAIALIDEVIFQKGLIPEGIYGDIIDFSHNLGKLV